VSINDLDKLIEELIKEKFSIKVKNGTIPTDNLKNAGSAGAHFKRPADGKDYTVTDPPEGGKGAKIYKNAAAFARIADDKAVLDDEDFKIAFDMDDNSIEKQIARNVMSKIRNPANYKNFKKMNHGFTDDELATHPMAKQLSKSKGKINKAKEDLKKNHAKAVKMGIENVPQLNLRQGLEKIKQQDEVIRNLIAQKTAENKIANAEARAQNSADRKKFLKDTFTAKPDKVDELNNLRTQKSLSSNATLDKSGFQLINDLLKTDMTDENYTWDKWQTTMNPVRQADYENNLKKIILSTVEQNSEQSKKLIALLALSPLTQISKIISSAKQESVTAVNDSNKDQAYTIKNDDGTYNFDPLKQKFKNLLATYGDKLSAREEISFKDPALKIQDLKVGSVTQDLFANLSVKDMSNTKGVQKNDVAKFVLILVQALTNSRKDVSEGLLKEEIDLSALATLINNNGDLKGTDILSSLENVEEDERKKEADRLISVFKSAYKQIEAEFEDKPQLKVFRDILNTLIRATEYYASGRQVRTKRGATTGWKVGTAQTSGTVRLDDQVKKMMFKAGGGASTTSAEDKLKKYSEFLDQINKNSFDDPTKSKDVSTLFSQFVGLEILVDTLFQTQEATVKGNLFEAFLALICGGSQVGADRGGADYQYGNVQGSAKLISSTTFSQATSNLAKPMEYVIAVKAIKTETGQVKRAKESDKIRYLKIYIVNTEQDENGDYIAYALKNKNNKVIGKISKTADNPETDEDETLADKATKHSFDISALLNDSYVCDFDFSFLEQAEFADVSTGIMNKINAQVEKAFSSLTNLRDNITRWVSDKDVIAANQVELNQEELSSAIEGMREGPDKVETTALSESIQQLDKLILEILQESLDK
jgi:hypothetical protein